MVFIAPRVKNCKSCIVASAARFRHYLIVINMIGILQYHNIHTKSRGWETEMWDTPDNVMMWTGHVYILTTILTLILLMWRIGWASKSTSIYIQQDATLLSLFISGNCSTCFGWYHHTSSGAHTTVSTASGIFQTVTAICRYCGRVGTGLRVLWVAYAIHSTLKLVPTLQR
jgi:hypothetical protein